MAWAPEVDRFLSDAPDRRSESFDVLFRRYFPSLVAACRGFVGEQVAEDIAQETLLRAMVHFHHLDPDRAWSWLRTVSRNLAVDHLRHHRREVPFELEHTGEPVAQEEPAIDVAAAMSALPSRQRIALGLRYLEDWDPQEIAAYLHVGEGALKQLLFRGRRRLRQEVTRLAEGAAALPLLTWRALRSRRIRRFRRSRRRLSVAAHAVALTSLVSFFGGGAPVATAKPPAPAVAATDAGRTLGPSQPSRVVPARDETPGPALQALGPTAHSSPDAACGAGRSGGRHRRAFRATAEVSRAVAAELMASVRKAPDQSHVVPARRAGPTGGLGCTVSSTGSPTFRAVEGTVQSLPLPSNVAPGSPAALERMLFALSPARPDRVLDGAMDDVTELAPVDGAPSSRPSDESN